MARGNHRSRPADGVPLSSIIGESAVMRAVLAWIQRIARTTLDVLITGETGTGKELVARAIHHLSGLTVFRALNVAALAPSLLESELFGHRKGSFTGADRDKRGFFAAAHGGTLFLDEIGDLPLETGEAARAARGRNRCPPRSRGRRGVADLVGADPTGPTLQISQC